MAEASKSGVSRTGKSALASREEASMPQERKSTRRRKGTKKNRGGKGSAFCKGRSTARRMEVS